VKPQKKRREQNYLYFGKKKVTGSKGEALNKKHLESLNTERGGRGDSKSIRDWEEGTKPSYENSLYGCMSIRGKQFRVNQRLIKERKDKVNVVSFHYHRSGKGGHIRDLSRRASLRNRLRVYYWRSKAL